MKPNFILVLIVGLAITPPISAQEVGDSTKNVKHQLGINATFFFKQFLDFSDNTIEPVSPYILTYTMVKGKAGLRFGVGGSYSSSKEGQDDFNFNRKTSSGSFDLRIGPEIQKAIAKRWLFFFGVDVITFYTIDKITTEVFNFQFNQTVSTESKTIGGGFGPVLGIQFNIHERVSLFTETALYFKASKLEDKETFDTFPQNNDSSTEKIKDLSFVLPTSLFLAVRFYK